MNDSVIETITAKPPATAERNRALILAFLDSWADSTPEKFAGPFADNGCYEDKAYGFSICGQAALRKHGARVQKHNEGTKVTIVSCSTTDTHGHVEWQLEHVFAGNFDGVDCSGKIVKMQGVGVYEFSDDGIVRASDYWNYMEMIRCVGVLPRELIGYPHADSK